MLTRRLLLNLVLLLAVAGLAAWIFYPRPAPPPAGVAVAPGLDTATVRHIRIERPGRPALVFVHRGGRWRLTAPIAARANSLMMRALLALPRERSRKRYAAAGLNLRRYGLKPPRASIRFGHVRIDLGSDNPVNHRRYVLSAGGLYLVRDQLSSLPQGAAADWVSLALLPPGAHIVVLRLPKLKVRLTPPSGWTLHPAPAHYRASQVARLIRAWTHASALQLSAASSTARTGQGHVRIRLADGKQIDLQIVATHPALILRNRALHVDYRLPGAAARHLLRLPAAAGAATAG